MITANQLVAHAVGDYILQSDWMANEKTKKSLAALVHVVTYTLPFLLLTQVWWALALIAGTHFVIDRWRLARYVCWVKNFAGPRSTIQPDARMGVDGILRVTDKTVTWWHPWRDCVGTGYHKDRPVWLSTWLLIITDNTMHVLINGAVLYYAS